MAALGTSLTDEHAEVLSRYVPRVVLVFDGDEAGARAAERGLDIALRCQLEVSLVALPAGQDPCDYLINNGAEAFEAALNSAPSALEFKWSQTLQGHRHGSSTAEKHQAVQQFVSYVGTSAAFGSLDVIQAGIIANQLCKLLGVGRKEVQSLLTAAQHGPNRLRSNRASPRSLRRRFHAPNILKRPQAWSSWSRSSVTQNSIRVWPRRCGRRSLPIPPYVGWLKKL